jgi:CTP:molybdopterin cytidylyltransferase MocA
MSERADSGAVRAFPVACVVLSLDAIARGESNAGGDAPCWAADVERAGCVRSIVEAAAHAGVEPIIASLPPGLEAPSPARVVVNTKGGGDLALRAGVAQLANTPAVGTLVWPLEEADAGLEVALAVLDAAKRTGAPIVAPVIEGADRWPVYFARDSWRELLTTPGGARAVLRHDASRVHRIATGAGIGAPGRARSEG